MKNGTFSGVTPRTVNTRATTSDTPAARATASTASDAAACGAQNCDVRDFSTPKTAAVIGISYRRSIRIMHGLSETESSRSIFFKAAATAHSLALCKVIITGTFPSRARPR